MPPAADDERLQADIDFAIFSRLSSPYASPPFPPLITPSAAIFMPPPCRHAAAMPRFAMPAESRAVRDILRRRRRRDIAAEAG